MGLASSSLPNLKAYSKHNLESSGKPTKYFISTIRLQSLADRFET